MDRVIAFEVRAVVNVFFVGFPALIGWWVIIDVVRSAVRGKKKSGSA